MPYLRDMDNLEDFEEALRNGTDLNARMENENYSLFEQLCKTPGKRDFIRVCLEYSAAYNVQNPKTKKYPIHLAAESLEVENLQELLGASRIEVDAKYEDKTALFILFSKLSAKNRNKSIECIKLLLQSGANINATNEEDIPPIRFLVDLGIQMAANEDERRSIEADLIFLLNTYRVNVDFRKGIVREKLKAHFPTIAIPEHKHDVSLEDLKSQLNTSKIDESRFLEMYQTYSQLASTDGTTFEKNHTELMYKAVEEGSLKIVQRLLENTSQNFWKQQTGEKLLAMCCNRGHVELLIILLGRTERIEAPLLSLVVKQLKNCKHETDTEKRNRLTGCLDVLLKSSKIYIEQRDEQRHTALYYAAKFQENEATLKLLDSGAYVGDIKDMPLQWLDAELLRCHLDDCITSNGKDDDDEEFEVKIDLKNFSLPPSDHETDYTRTLQQMADMPHISKLLLHPVPASLLMKKWHKLQPLLIFNLGVVSILFILAYMLLRQPESERSVVLYGITGILWFYIAGREIVQLHLYGLRLYFSSFSNIVDLGFIFACGFAPFYKKIAVLAIVLLAVQAMLLFRPFEWFATQLVMFVKIAKDVFWSLLLFGFLFLAFAFSFSTFFGDSEHSNDGVPSEKNDEHERKFQRFEQDSLAIVKTIVMFSGEFDAGHIPFHVTPWSYFFCGLFFFCCVLVLQNLVNAIAVSDSWKISSESELIHAKQKLIAIDEYQKITKKW
uniref:Ion transport domain-containing protein n=1 Tax=Anopheles atroparvus TaxID=41427 RepID=A0AAG5CPI2_ANOAO